MSISLLSFKSEESKFLSNGRYKCFVNGRNLYITDGINQWEVNQAELTELEERLTAIINGKADSNHNHDSTYAQLSHSHEISDITNLQSSLDGKADSNHSHEISDIYKTITSTVNGSTLTIYKPLETLLDERESAIRTLINGKANSSHTHNATEVIYKAPEGNNPAITVKKQLDDIMAQIQVFDEDGTRHDIFDIIFGAGTVIGGAIDGGLIYAVATLQSEVAALTTATTALQGTQTALNATGNALGQIDSISDLSDLSFESFDEVGEAIQNPLQESVNKVGDLFNSHSQYMRLGNENIYGSISNTTSFASSPTTSLLITPEIL